MKFGRLVLMVILICCGSVHSQDRLIDPPINHNESSQGQGRVEAVEQVQTDHGSRRNFGQLAESPNSFQFADVRELLRFEAIVRELDLVSEQSRELLKLESDLRQKRRSARQEAMTNQRQSSRKQQDSFLDREVALDLVKAESQTSLDEILLPDQRRRLDEVATELSIRSQGVYRFLNDRPMIDRLKIDEDQLRELRVKAVASARKLDAEILKLKREIRVEMLSVLNEFQAAELEVMIGEPFRWRPENEK